ncbi:Trk system potassium transporter TrkA [Chlamydiales bacterium]|nr:Trk system potassium transporter TrkA [Chlamydiales bacterium]
MLNIVIIGAGDVGRYIALMLSKEQHNVILVDKDPKKLESASTTMDVGTRLGIGTDWELLDDLLDSNPDFLISLTPEDEFNLTACSIAKNLGYPKTIARVKDNRYLNRTRLDFARVFDVDYFVCPELLVANDIQKYMLSFGSLAVETFAHGAIQLRTLVVPYKWKKGDIPISELDLPEEMIIGLIKRATGENQNNSPSQIIFPHGNHCILPGDEVTCIGQANIVSEIHHYFDSHQKPINSVVIIGGSATAVNLVRLLDQKNISIRIIEKDYDRCVILADLLPNCTIINQDGTHLDFLLSEKIEMADLVIASTRTDEVNMMIALIAKQAGSKQVVVILSKADYHPIAEQLGISHAVSPRLATANRLLSLILSSRVTSCVSLYENQAEIVEIQISLDSKIVGIPINELGPLLPKDFLIAVIQNRGRIIVANGNRILSPGDSVIVVTHPRHLNEFKKVF